MGEYDTIIVQAETAHKRTSFLNSFAREDKLLPNSYKWDEKRCIRKGSIFTLTLLPTAQMAGGVPLMWTRINEWKNRDEWKVPPPNPPSEAYMYGWLASYWSGTPKATLGIYEDPSGRKWIDTSTLVEYDGYPNREYPKNAFRRHEMHTQEQDFLATHYQIGN